MVLLEKKGPFLKCSLARAGLVNRYLCFNMQLEDREMDEKICGKQIQKMLRLSTFVSVSMYNCELNGRNGNYEQKNSWRPFA